MLLDLWSYAIILSDIIEFVIYWAEHETFTVSFGLTVLTFCVLAYFAWRSTDIPHDVPSPPRPPFIITIQGTTLNNGGRRQSLSDVRILASSPYGTNGSTRSNDQILRPRNTLTTTPTVSIDPVIQVTEGSQRSTEAPSSEQILNQHPRQVLGIHGTRSLFFGFLRHRPVTRPILPTRPSLRTRFSQGPNVVVYHRIYHPSAPNLHAPAPAVVPLEISTPGETANGVQTNNGFVSNQSEIVPEQTLPRETNSDNTSSSAANSARSGEESIRNSQVDSCILERSYSDSDLSLRELSYRSSEVTTELDTNSKPDDLQSSTSNMDSSNSSSNDVKFTLKFLNDTQKEVTTQLNEKISDFKARHFAVEMNENKMVRLIFNGRVLDNDNKTICESGIFNQCVVHCLIVTPQPSQQSQGGGHPSQRYGNRSGPRGPEPGLFFVSFMGIILVFLWFICFNFGQQLFTQSAVVSLSVLTAIFLIGLIAFYLPVHPNNQNPN